MAIANYNLDKIVSQAIHRPRILTKGTDLPPLYARVEGNNEVDFDSEGRKNPIWIKAASTVYNSPTNVKRVFIGDTEAVIELYHGYKEKGNTSNLAIKYSYSFDNNKNGINSILDAGIRSAFNKPDLEGNRVQLKGTGIGAVSSGWVMNNIEEIYFTPSILLADGIINRFAEAKKMISILLNSNMEYIAGKVATHPFAGQLFIEANAKDLTDVHKRFPRLRIVGIVSNLDVILNRFWYQLTKSYKTPKYSIGSCWYEDALAVKATELGSFIISKIEHTNDVYTKFAIRPGVYKFDQEYLVAFTEKYTEKVIETARNNRDSKKNKENEVTEKSNLELYLDSLYEKEGKEVLSAVMQLTFGRTNNEQLNEVFNQFTKEGKEKYRALLGR